MLNACDYGVLYPLWYLRWITSLTTRRPFQLARLTLCRRQELMLTLTGPNFPLRKEQFGAEIDILFTRIETVGREGNSFRCT